jgi:transcriptional regulator with XRE-family HTH domain
MNENDFILALKEAVARAGTQSKLAKRIGCSQGNISDYLTGRCSIGNMTVSTMLRFFPEIQIHFFGDQEKDETVEELKAELIRIFDSLSSAERVHLLSLVAANFGKKSTVS